MANYLVREGIDTYHVYGVETTEGTKASTVGKTLGLTQSFSFNPNNNIVRPRGSVGYLTDDNDTTTSRDAQAVLRGNFEGSISIGFQPNNFEFMEFVMGSASGAGTTASPYEYPQASASTIADKKKYLKIPSLTWSTNALWDGTGDSADGGADLLGAKIGSCDIRAASGEPVSVSLTVPFMKLSPKNTIDNGVAIDADDVYHFTGCKVEVPTGTAIDDIISDFTLSINNGVSFRHGLGSHVPKKLFSGNREITFSMNLTNEGTRWMKALDAFTVYSNIVLEFTGDNGRTFEVTLFNVATNDINVQGTHPNPVDENVTLHPTHMKCEEITDAA